MLGKSILHATQAKRIANLANCHRSIPQNSNRIICSAVFGFDEKLAVRNSLRFQQNCLVISSVDIQSVEPVDQRTRDALQKSVQLAIEITTNAQEAAARYHCCD